MQTVSSTLLTALTATPKKLAVVVEIYDQDAVPTSSGFDPSGADLLLALAKVDGITFKGVDYDRYLTKGGIGTIKRTLRKELSTFSFTVSNSDRAIIDFEYDYGFEGKICVVRLIDREVSTDLEDSIVLFTGRCEKIQNFNKSSESGTVQVKQILNQTEVKVPRRKFTVDDVEGRSPSDVEFEGFRVTQRSGSVTYTEKVKTRFLFFFSKTKKVQRTLQYSSHSDLDQERAVPLALGRVQQELINFAYEDLGEQINILSMACDGYENGITWFENYRSTTPNFPYTMARYRLGELGNTGQQTIGDPTFIATNYYSRTAYLEGYVTGSLKENDDPAPQLVSVVLGLKVPNYNADGDFTDTTFSDNGVVLSRWALQSAYIFGLDTAWLDDVEMLNSALYCNQVLVDQTNSETVLLDGGQNGIAGTDYKNYLSGARLTPHYFLNESGADTDQLHWKQEVDYQYYTDTPVNSDDWTGDGTSTLPPTTYRRRYTTNVFLTEQMSALDFLFDVLFPSFNGYLVQKASGKLAIRVTKPVEFSFVYTASIATATTIKVFSIKAWLDTTGQRILIGANRSTSEVRTVESAAYDTSIAKTITATGNCSSSSGTLTGGSSSVAPHATITVSSAATSKVITIDGYVMTYVPTADDTTDTCAGFIAAMINSHNILNKYISAIWVAGESTVLVEQKIGIITLDSALENAHNTAISTPTTPPTLSEVSSGSLPAGTYSVGYSFNTLEGETLAIYDDITIAANKNIGVASLGTLPARVTSVNWFVSVEANGVRVRLHSTNDGTSFNISSLPKLNARVEPVYNSTAEEIHNIAMAFSDKAETQSALTRSNMLKGSFQFPMGSRQPSTNEILIKYRDASQDFKLTELRVRDTEHIAKVKKINTKEINGAAIDSYHQARRLANQKLAEWRDGDFFHGFSSDGEALLLEEGDVICVTEDSGRFINEPIRVEDVTISDNDGYPKIEVIGRKYRRYYYDDQIQEKLVPLPILINAPLNVEQGASAIAQSGTATNTAVTLVFSNFTQTAQFRKLQFSDASDMSNILQTLVVDASTTGGVLPNEQVFTKVSETSALTRYFQVSHSSNGETYGNLSNILSVTFASSGGSGGGSGALPPTLISVEWDSIDTSVITWSPNGGSGTYTLSRRIRYYNTPLDRWYNWESWSVVSASISSGDVDYSNYDAPQVDATQIEYRVARNDIAGTSNVIQIEVPAV